jgi:hypothetical protein
VKTIGGAIRKGAKVASTKRSGLIWPKTSTSIADVIITDIRIDTAVNIKVLRKTPNLLNHTRHIKNRTFGLNGKAEELLDFLSAMN